MIYHKKLIFITMLTAYTMQIDCGSAATLLATMLKPGAGGGGAIGTSGSYYLNWDIGTNASPGLITITASDVILDMNWHLLNGNIVIQPGVQHVEIRNGYIDATGIGSSTPALAIGTNDGAASNNIYVSDMTIRNSPQNGIQAINVNYLFITDVLVQNDPANPNVGDSSACLLQRINNAYVKDSVFVGYAGPTNGGGGFVSDSIQVGNATVYNTNVVVENCTGISNTTNFNLFGTEDDCGIALVDCHAFSASTGNPASPFSVNGFADTADSAEFFNCVADSASGSGFIASPPEVGPASGRPLFNQCLAQNAAIGFSIQIAGTIQECLALNNTNMGFSAIGTGPASRCTTNFAHNNATNYNPSSGDPFQPLNNVQTGNPVAQWWRNTFFSFCG